MFSRDCLPSIIFPFMTNNMSSTYIEKQKLWSKVKILFSKMAKNCGLTFVKSCSWAAMVFSLHVNTANSKVRMSQCWYGLGIIRLYRLHWALHFGLSGYKDLQYPIQKSIFVKIRESGLIRIIMKSGPGFCILSCEPSFEPFRVSSQLGA